MALQDEMRKNGDRLFCWRSYLPLFLIFLFAIGIREFKRPDEDMDRAWELFCILVSLAGMAVRVLTVGYVPGGTSGRNTKKQLASTLNTTGMYSIVRHPLYLGNFLIWLGLSLFIQQWWFSVIIMLFFWVYYERIMLAEEGFLLDSFGGEFTDWAMRTPAFIPRTENWIPSPRGFSLRRVLRREYSSLFGLLATFTLLEVASDFVTDHRWTVDVMWLDIFLFGLGQYLLLRTLKKTTRWLHDDGDENPDNNLDNADCKNVADLL
jgi:protein-S-isoprenylcysteine O-methyltransferase Ste14